MQSLSLNFMDGDCISCVYGELESCFFAKVWPQQCLLQDDSVLVPLEALFGSETCLVEVYNQILRATVIIGNDCIDCPCA